MLNFNPTPTLARTGWPSKSTIRPPEGLRLLMAKAVSLVTAVSQPEGEGSSVKRKNRLQDDEDLPFIIYARASMLGRSDSRMRARS